MEESSTLSDLYPNIGCQLQNRHSAHFSNLRRRFAKIYQDFQPEYFISVKGICSVFSVSSTSISASMAIENGLVMAVAATYPNSDVYINCFDQEEEIVLNCKGEVKEGNSGMAKAVSEAYEMALADYPVKNLSGGIVFFDFNIKPEARGYKEAIRMGFALAALVINKSLNKQTLQELQQRVMTPPLQKIKYSQYNNLTIVFDDHCHKPVLNTINGNNFNLLLCDARITAEQRKAMQETKGLMDFQLEFLEAIAEKMYPDEAPEPGQLTLTSMSISKTIGDLFGRIQEGRYTVDEYEKMLGCDTNKRFSHIQDKIDLRTRLQTFTNQISTLTSLSQSLTKQSLISSLNLNSSLMSQHYPKRLTDLIDRFVGKQALAMTIVDTDKLLVVCEKKKMLALFEKLKKELFDEDCKGSHRVSREDRVSETKKMLFSTLPSRGCGVLDPTKEMWFQ